MAAYLRWRYTMAYTITISNLTQEQTNDLRQVLDWGNISYKITLEKQK